MAWEARSGLKLEDNFSMPEFTKCRNGLGSPFGFETDTPTTIRDLPSPSERPGKPVRV
jgi:hypothetical protein